MKKLTLKFDDKLFSDLKAIAGQEGINVEDLALKACKAARDLMKRNKGKKRKEPSHVLQEPGWSAGELGL